MGPSSKAAGPSRSWLARVISFLALHVVAMAGLGWFYVERWKGDDEYLCAWRDKYERLRSTPSPRILLAGGSSVAFGFDSPAIEAAFARPVVNLGLHAAIGREVVLREIESEARAGDLVVVSFEYVQFFHPFVGDEILELVAQNPEAARFLDFGSTREILDNGLPFLARMPQALLARIRGKSRPEPPPYYARAAFNAWGDAVAHHGLERHKRLLGDLSLRGFTAGGLRRGIRRLNRFRETLAERGATAVVFFPAVPADELRSLHEPFVRLEAALRDGLRLPILNSPLEMGYPRELFFDTTYHMTKDGAERRTRLLVERLQPIIAPAGAVR